MTPSDKLRELAELSEKATPLTDAFIGSVIEVNTPHTEITTLSPKTREQVIGFARTLERALARRDALLREVDGRISNVLRGVPMRDLDEWLESIRHELGEK